MQKQNITHQSIKPTLGQKEGEKIRAGAYQAAENQKGEGVLK